MCALLIPPTSALAFDVPAAVLKAEQERIEAIDKGVRCAVAVFSPDGNGGGSGVVITPDGYALSNYHVTSPVGNFMKCGMADGELYDAVIVGIDPTGDVALIKLFGRDDFPVAELSDSDEVRVGDWCFAVGNPFLLATDLKPTVSYGIVSGVHRYQYPAGTLLEYADCIQTDAAINPGNSGGPLFNAEGKLIGINGRGSFEKRGRVNVGLGYAISINQIKNFMGHLRSGRVVDHATLGATVVSDEGERVIVSNILENSDAYRRGLRYGDQILSFGGRRIDSVNAFKNALGIFPRGWRVPLSFLRSGDVVDVHVRLAGVHAREELLQQIQQTPANPPQGEPRPDRLPLPQKKPSATPEKWKDYYEARTGFANFYFNKINQERVWKSFLGDESKGYDGGNWRLEGRLPNGEAVSFTLGERDSTGEFPRAEVRVDGNEDLTKQNGPAGSGGLVAALHLWRRLLVHGPTDFGQMVYLGTAPIPGREGRFDVLVGNFDVAETHFYFDPETGHLALTECFLDLGVDPCEIYFDHYEAIDGRQFPRQMIVWHGDSLVAQIELVTIQVSEEVQREL